MISGKVVLAISGGVLAAIVSAYFLSSARTNGFGFTESPPASSSNTDGGHPTAKGQSRPKEGTPYTSARDGFEVVFPLRGAVEVATQPSHQTDEGVASVTDYYVSDDDFVFVVEVTRYPQGLYTPDRESAFLQEIEASMVSRAARVFRRFDTEVGKAPGPRVHGRTIEVELEGGARLRNTFFLHGGWLYSLGGAPNRQAPVARSSFESFVKSMKLEEPRFAPFLVVDDEQEKAKLAATKALGSLPKDEIQATVREHFPKLRACYQEGLERDATLTGTISLRFMIETDGSVGAARAEEASTLGDPSVRKCVLDRFRKLHFSAPEGGKVMVTYPLRFVPE